MKEIAAAGNVEIHTIKRANDVSYVKLLRKIYKTEKQTYFNVYLSHAVS